MKKNKTVKLILWAIILVYGIFSVYLYYKQVFHVEGMPFESDLPYHISMAVEDHWFYSLTAGLYLLFFLTPFGELLTALFLGAVTVGTIFSTYVLFLELEKRSKIAICNKNLYLLGAILCNIAMPFYVRAAHYQRYIGYQSATIWHNSTYLCMKLCGIWAVIIYLRLEHKYRDGLSAKDWFIMAAAFVVTSAVKPSFLLVFAPVMAIYLLLDLFKKTKFIRIFIFGLTVIPSLLIMLLQSMVLFGQDTGNTIEIRYGYTLTLHSLHPKITLLLSIAFPLFVLLFLWKDLFVDKWYLFSWLVWGMGLIQVTFLSESGARARDGNFMWGYSFGIFFILVLSVKKVLEVWKKPKGIFMKKLFRVGFLISSMMILSYQSFCGIVFFIRLCRGITYWM